MNFHTILSRCFCAFAFLLSLSASAQVKNVQVSIDLKNVVEDKVPVTVNVDKIKSETINYMIPKIVPGTYAIFDFGKYIDTFRAYDKKGNLLPVTKSDDNTWKIEKAKSLVKITYLVNDTYDIEGEHDIFSPGGTNILAGKNFVLNLHGFVGYFEGLSETPYDISITHPAELYGSTALEDTDNSPEVDLFKIDRYFTVTDNPIQYDTPDTLSFKLNDIKVELSVYSKNKIHTAEELRAPMEKMMQAQKKFLGDINSTKIYSILLYLSDATEGDAQGYGALEHHNATMVVLPEETSTERLIQDMVDVVSHEFFHTLTPLSVHSEEIQFFDFNKPKMSQHLWMYEGVTEYFANLFQVREGLINQEDFYNRMMDKLYNSLNFNDSIPFTEMSKNILVEPYKENYQNVYEKGAIIGMCIDILIREKTAGKEGILDMLKKLSAKYGADKPFKDDELFGEIVALGYPEAGDFLNSYVADSKTIPYMEIFDKVGVTFSNVEKEGGFFIDGNVPYITVNQDDQSLFFVPYATENNGLKAWGIEAGDVIKTINGTAYNLLNVYELVEISNTWKADDDIELVVIRNGEEISLKSKIVIPTIEVTVLENQDLPADDPRIKIQRAWLRQE
jgi:predicted metalloprotease with PDZ domain